MDYSTFSSPWIYLDEESSPYFSHSAIDMINSPIFPNEFTDWETKLNIYLWLYPHLLFANFHWLKHLTGTTHALASFSSSPVGKHMGSNPKFYTMELSGREEIFKAGL